MIIDASILISLLIPSDVNHKRVVSFVEHTEDDCFTPSFALVETTSALKRNKAPERAISGFRNLLRKYVEVVETDENLIVQSVSVAKRVRTRGAASVYVALAEDMEESLAALTKKKHDWLWA